MNLLNNYVRALLESIEQNLSTYKKNKKPVCLHRLRVEIKNIRAIFSFAENIYSEKHVATRLKPLFQKAGILRELHLHLHLLRAAPHPPKRLINQLKKKENVLIQKFIKNVSRYIMLIKDFREKTCLPEMLGSKKKIVKYFEIVGNKARIILQHKDRERMHRYRKKIKKLMYVYNALPKKMQNAIELNMAEINKQQKKLGDWHDTYSAIDFISQEHIPLKAADYVLKLKEKEERQFSTLHKYFTNKHKYKGTQMPYLL